MKHLVNRIHNEDWQDFTPRLKDNILDLVYTDPPYEMKYSSQIPADERWNQSGISESKFDRMHGDHKGGVNWKALAHESFRLLKLNSFLFIHMSHQNLLDYGFYFKQAGFRYQGCIAWNKKFCIGGNLSASLRRSWEPIFYFSKGSPTFNPIKVHRNGKLEKRSRISEIDDWVFQLQASEKIGHPTQKPIELAKQVIRLTTKKKDLVFDPFAGSGTFIAASQELGRDFIACEIDTNSHELVEERLMHGATFELHCDNELKILSSLEFGSINLVVTDIQHISKSDSLDWLNHLPVLLSDNGSAIVFCDWKNIGEVLHTCTVNRLETKEMLRWEITNPPVKRQGEGYAKDYEIAIWITKPKSKVTFNKDADDSNKPSYRTEKIKQRGSQHRLNNKPVSLIKEIIKTHSNEGDNVLDPFMGSGIVGEAALSLKRNFIGIEKHKLLFNQAKKAIEG